METKVTWTDKTKEPTHFIPLSEFVELTDDIETIRKYAKLCKLPITIDNLKRISGTPLDNAIFSDMLTQIRNGNLYATLDYFANGSYYKFAKPLSKILEEI